MKRRLRFVREEMEIDDVSIEMRCLIPIAPRDASHRYMLSTVQSRPALSCQVFAGSIQMRKGSSLRPLDASGVNAMTARDFEHSL